ncbi:MAG: toprim domain-containing protein [Acidobacteria bacterium]|nr:toprim domain-containing protein [Acidobacteriota bacterium]
MPRIPINLITWLKREIPIEALILAAGIELKRVGENLVGRCNRHDDKTPSLVVSPEKGLWHCMGACQKGGSVIDWVMFQREIEFPEAVRVLLEEHAPERLHELTEPKPPKKREKAELPCPLSKDAEGAALAREVIEYYHAKGKVSREFAEYLEKRGLNDAELVETFKLGYADRTLGMTLTASSRKKLQEIGFFRTTGHELLNGSLVIPVLGENGEVLGCYGRKVRDDLRTGTPDHLYLPGPHRGVFNVAAFKCSSEMILCEALIDALSFWRHGFRNVTAAYGVNGFTDELLEAFVSHGIERVFIAFDRDEAGDKGAETVAKKLSAKGIACYRVLFPKGMDANEVSLKMHPAKKTFEFFLRGAEWMCGGSLEGSALLPKPVLSKPRNGEPVEVAGLSSAESLLPLAAGSLPAAEVSSFTSSLVASDGSGSEMRAEECGETEKFEGTVPVEPEPGEAAKEGKDEDFELGGKARPAAKKESSQEAAKERSPAFTHCERAAASPSAGPVLPAANEAPPAPVIPAAPVMPARAVAVPPGSAGPRAPANSPPVSSAPPRAGDPLVSLTEEEAVFLFDDRRYRVRGMKRNTSFDTLKVNIMATREGIDFEGTPLSGFHADTFDLYIARFRQLFERQASQELGLKDEVVKRDMKALVGKLEAIQVEAVRRAHEPKVKAPILTEQETAEAVEFWKSPNLLDRIVSDITKCGLVGETVNKLVTYIAAVSRLADRPLAIIIQSNSAAGKSTLMDAILSLMPEESREKYTAVSGRALFYFDENTSLSHKILAVVEEEGAEKATYPLKLLYSEGELVMASTGKDPHTGKLVTQIYKVKGPVMIIFTTTQIELDPELENRCMKLTVDESREQTRLIHELQRQRQTLEALSAKKEKERIQKLHQNAQRLLRPLNVLNPFIRELTFVDDQTRTRRDHDKYLTLIEAITLMHQHQRPVKHVKIEGEMVECIDVTLDDIETANRLAGEILGRTLDELPPQTRRFLNLLHEKVKPLYEENNIEQRDFRFTRRNVREWLGWSDFPVRVHLDRLVSLEYVLVHRGERGQSFVYELLYRGEGEDGKKFVLGLVDVAKLRKKAATTATSMGEAPQLDGPKMGQRCPKDGPLMPPSEVPESACEAALPKEEAKKPENALIPPPRKTGSYRKPSYRPAVTFNLLKFPPAQVPPPVTARPRSGYGSAASKG